jgi:DNA polymerase (family 10)
LQNAEDVARGLAEIAALLELSSAQRFRVRAYRQGAAIVEGLGDQLGQAIESGRLSEIEGIGRALAREIDELWNLGHSDLLERLRRESPPGASELIQVAGMTPRRLRTLHDALGIDSVLALRAACAAGKVRAIKGLGEKTEALLARGCESWLARAGAPRQVLLVRAATLLDALKDRLHDVAQVELAGAARRGQETVGELEVVITASDDEAVWERLAGWNKVVRVARADGRVMLNDGIPLCLHFVARPGLHGLQLLRATGGAGHLQALRSHAAERGSDDPLALDTKLEFADESAVYASLGLHWVPPELRNDDSTAQAASVEPLVSLTDLQGQVHCHTVYSDGVNSIEEMARAAHAQGMKYITITDHSPSAHYARGVQVDRLKQQWDEIAEVQERVPIRILRGTESDILSDGSLDFPDAILEQFDVIIASIHARLRMDRAAMTSRLSRAMALPCFKIWGHGLGRVLLQRDPIDCDVPHVLDALAASRGAVEINADPHRLDLPPHWLCAARERGLRFVISADAHSVRGLEVLGFGVTMARRAGITPSEVLNTRSADEFARSVRPI